MKNSASELFALDHDTAYQHAFSYIRQLAAHLRNSMKVKTKVHFFSRSYFNLVEYISRNLTSKCIIGNMLIAWISGFCSWQERAVPRFKAKKVL